MRSDKFLWKVCMEMYREMYQKATPSADIDELIASGETKKEGWFKNYYLPQEEYEEIYDRLIKKHRLSKHEKSKIAFEVHLGAGPTCVKPKEWDEKDN